MSPNDPKLSDSPGWRDRCAAGERRRQEAAGVTAGRVRCSAWLGVIGLGYCELIPEVIMKLDSVLTAERGELLWSDLRTT